MKVDTPTAGISLPQLQKREQDHNVQNTFSAVLAEAGRKGYASAEPLDDEQPLTESIVTSWNSWLSGELNGRYQQATNQDELKQTFGEILVRAHEEGGYVDPKSFLNNLSHDELAVVQRVQSLATGIRVDSLTEEGAVNLLLPPAAQVDLNRDGLTRTGVAYGGRFPDSNTPLGVTRAWEEATEGMDFGELAVAQLQMISPAIMANIKLDDQGAFLHRYEPGDPEYKNPMAAENYSYLGVTQDRLSYLESMKQRMSAEKYEQQTSFWSKFRDSLIKHDVN